MELQIWQKAPPKVVLLSNRKNLPP
ncbi:hypothetical protein CCACVL1_29567 [Corchorus capsularis]|uniref:Uncharacterized protein n=1 Tax=Corchorus capsularis TaxID=210143 RepID=A0A1R3G151_COCAP|nr:hypothetical protein CCACVL1_29567 [Corchorus capsularis]